MLGLAVMALTIGQAQIPRELEFVWQRRTPAERETTAQNVVRLFWAAGGPTFVSAGKQDSRGGMWRADFEASGIPVRVQHDGDSDEWLMNRLDLAPVLPVAISHEDASRELLAVRDRLIAVGLLDEANFSACQPDVVETRLGGGSVREPREEQVVELTARCRASHMGVPVMNLGIQVRFRAGGLSSIRFSRARVVKAPSSVNVARPTPISASEVSVAWPRLHPKENSVVYFAEEKPSNGAITAHLVQLVAGAENYEGGVSRTRILVRRSGEDGWVEPRMGEQFTQAAESR